MRRQPTPARIAALLVLWIALGLALTLQPTSPGPALLAIADRLEADAAAPYPRSGDEASLPN